MRINSINTTNFKGLWQNDRAANFARTKDDEPINSVNYIYRPFADETKEEIRQTVEEYSVPMYGVIDKMDDNAYGYAAYVIPNIEIGPKLSMTKEQYNAYKNELTGLKEKTSIVPETTQEYSYDVLSEIDAGRVLKNTRA